MAIKWKILNFLLIITIIPVLVVGFFVQRRSSQTLKEVLIENGNTSLKVVRDKMRGEEDKLERIGERLKTNKELINAIKMQDPSLMYVKMNRLIKKEKLDFLAFTLPDGKVVRRGNNSRNFMDKLPFSKIFAQAKDSGEVVSSYVTYPVKLLEQEDTPAKKISDKLVIDGEKRDALALISVVPVEFFGDVVGYFVLGNIITNNGEIYNQRLKKLVFSDNQEEISSFSGIKFNGEYILSNNKFWTKNKGLKGLTAGQIKDKFLLFEDAIKDVSGDKIATVSYGIPKIRLESSKRASLLVTLKIILAVILVIVSISLFFSFKISNKIAIVVDKFKRIADGDLTTKLEINSNDEIGQLGTEFNKTIKSQADILKNILMAIEDISAYSEELSASSEEGKAATETTAHRIGEITSVIEQVAKSSQEVSIIAHEAYSKTEQGEERIEKIVPKMKEISGSVEKAEGIIQGLDATSQQISGIVEMITGIAEQTNLLALNASIEAARASSSTTKGFDKTRRGEAGQGFAVVADEIKELAGETTKATKKAIKLIEEIQRESNQGLMAIKEVSKETKEGVKVIEDTGQAFNEIADVVGNTSAYTQETTASTQELASNSEEINDATTDISHMANEITESSEKLSQMACDLRKLVDEYKL